MALTRKRFTSRDSKGCEFVCEALYDERVYSNGKFTRTARYSALGLSASSLKELQAKIGAKA